MKLSRRTIVRTILAAIAIVLVAMIAAPYISAGGFRNRIHAALESSLERQVTIGAVHYSLFPRPGFTLEDVDIADVPAAGVEPFVHVAELKAGLRISSFLTGRMAFATLRLEEPTVNLVRMASGAWNIQPVVSRAVISGSGPHDHERAPDIEVRSGRINFKFVDTKSVFYISDADVDVYANSSGALVIHFEGEPSRTDHGAQGFGRLTAQGMLRAAGAAGDQLTVGVQLERSSIEEICRLLGTGDPGFHGGVVANAHFSGPIAHPAITGDLTLDGVHRWDMMPSSGEPWTVNYRGALDVRAQKLELETLAPDSGPRVISARLDAAGLSAPQWALSVVFDGLPAGALIETARRFGAPLPHAVAISGKVTGDIGYVQPGGLKGKFALSSSSIQAPGAAPVRADGAEFVIDGGVVSFGPASVQFDDGDAAEISARFDNSTNALSFQMNTRALAAVRVREATSSLLSDSPIPLLAATTGGVWHGMLSFARATDGTGVWSGNGELTDAVTTLPGLAPPLHIASASIAIRGPEVVVTHLRGHAGKLGIDADYHFSGRDDIADRLRLNVGPCDLADLFTALAPALERREGLLARLRLRRPVMPEWLKERNIAGSVQVRGLTAGDTPLGSMKAALRWEGATINLRNGVWSLGNASGTGAVAISLAGAAPLFTLNGSVEGLPWDNGTLDLDGFLTTRGMGLDALLAATAEGTFNAQDVTLAPDVSFDEIAGNFHLTAAGGAAPRLLLDRVQARGDRDVLTGQGASQPDGRIALDLLSAGRKPVRYVAQGFSVPAQP